MIKEMPVSKYEKKNMVIQRNFVYANMQHPNKRDVTPTCNNLIKGIVPKQVHKFHYLGSDLKTNLSGKNGFPEHEKHFILERYIT